MATLLTGQSNNPVGVAVDPQGFIYVADMGNSRVQKFDRSGQFLTKWGSPGAGPGQFRKPKAIVVDAQNNGVGARFRNRQNSEILARWSHVPRLVGRKFQSRWPSSL